MEIKVGERVRTRQGFIAKVEQITEELILFDNVIYEDWEEDWCLHLTNKYGKKNQSEDITKHSKNIIDLIEKGDYVNGEKVVSILNGFVEGTMEIELANHKKIYRKNVNEIKTIVTKEQFEQNAYRLEN